MVEGVIATSNKKPPTPSFALIYDSSDSVAGQHLRLQLITGRGEELE